MKTLDANEREKHRAALMARYRAFQARHLQIDMTRGKPCPKQLDLSAGMLTIVFSICQHLGIEMIPIEMRADDPDMDAVEASVAEDACVKGMWCVPKYSNPTGVAFSDEVVERLAHMPTAAKDFRLFWDNAYAVHHLSDTPDRLSNVLAACKRAGNPDRVFLFGSTS
ncbi:MAG: aminotransferase class I/II-fold pyridoxal phosphate-dependent enzyme, partial [Armatimonadota bacterium]